MNELIGKLLYGYCEGVFGRDSYHTKMIEAFGFDWLVVRKANSKNDNPEFAFFDGPIELKEFVKKNSSKEAELEWRDAQ